MRQLTFAAIAIAVTGCQWFLVFDQKLAPSASVVEAGADANGSTDAASKGDASPGADGSASGFCAGDYVLCEDFERPDTNDPWSRTEEGGGEYQWVDAGANESAGAIRFDAPPPSGRVYLLSKTLPDTTTLDCELKLKYEMMPPSATVDVNVCGMRSGTFELAMDVYGGELQLKPNQGAASGDWAQLGPERWRHLQFKIGSSLSYSGVWITQGAPSAPYPLPLLPSPIASPQIWIGAIVSNATAPAVTVWVDEVRCRLGP